MRLLVGGAKSKFFHLREFCDALARLGVECKLIHDVEIYDGFPSKNIKNWFQGKQKFEQLVNDFKPDAIFVDRQRHFTLAAAQSDIPCFMLLRGDYWKEMEWAKETIYKTPHRRYALRKWNEIGTKCFINATMVLPICKYLERVVKDQLPDKKTSVLYGGIDSTRWFDVEPINLKHPCVGLLQGAWIWGKTKEMLTLTKVMEAMPHVTFYWAGDGPYRNKIIKEFKNYSNFQWLGPLQYPNKVREYLASIDIYALASGIDMSPLTLQEAQLMRRPVIATNSGGIPELMIDGKTGFLVDSGDYESWIKKIDLLLNNKEISEEMGCNGREFIQGNFDWKKIAQHFVTIMQDCLQKK